LARVKGNTKAQVLATTLDQATGKFLDERKSPSRKVGELDNRGSHFYLAMYWAEALASQNDDQSLQSRFSELSQTLLRDEYKIVDELNLSQGKTVNVGGYYRPDFDLASKAMCPSETFNTALKLLEKIEVSV